MTATNGPTTAPGTALMQWDPFQAMDQLDDDMIVAELEGRVIKALVYEYQQDGKTVRGLSKIGVDAVGSEMAKQGEVLRELTLDCNDAGEEAFCKCQVGRYAVRVNKETGEVHEVLLETAFGVKRQPKYYPRKRDDEPLRLNPFWYETGCMKAARNAKMRLIREDLKQQVIEAAIREGRSQQVRPPAVQQRGQVPPLANHAPIGDPREVAPPRALQPPQRTNEDIDHDNLDTAPTCACGPRVYRSGTKNGKAWAAWMCASRPGVCEPQWVDLNAPKPLSEQLAPTDELLRDAYDDLYDTAISLGEDPARWSIDGPVSAENLERLTAEIQRAIEVRRGQGSMGSIPF